MNLKGLFTVLIKIMAIYIMVQGILLFPQILNALSYITQDSIFWTAIVYLIEILLIISLDIIIGLFLIFRTDWLVNKIIREDKLEAEIITFKIHRSIILTIAVIVIGGLTIVNELPNLFRQIYNLKIESGISGVTNYEFVIISLVKILIGLYLVYYNNLIVVWIEKQRKG